MGFLDWISKNKRVILLIVIIIITIILGITIISIGIGIAILFYLFYIREEENISEEQNSFPDEEKELIIKNLKTETDKNYTDNRVLGKYIIPKNKNDNLSDKEIEEIVSDKNKYKTPISKETAIKFAKFYRDELYECDQGGDGNCLFLSLAASLRDLGFDINHKSLRAEMCEYGINGPGKNIPRIYYASTVHKKFKKYWKNLCKDKSWGDQIILGLVAKKYNVTIIEMHGGLLQNTFTPEDTDIDIKKFNEIKENAIFIKNIDQMHFTQLFTKSKLDKIK